MAALPPNDSQQGAIDEAKLWVDQISLVPKPANLPVGSRPSSNLSSTQICDDNRTVIE
jgi:hypothetical protein